LSTGAGPPFRLLDRLYADDGMAAIFSEERTIGTWLQTEAALARAQAAAGILRPEDADAITAVAVMDTIDPGRLWAESRNVGYPILPLVRMLAAALPAGPNGRVHYGATTQDIMDTGLALQLSAALLRLDELASSLGDRLAHHLEEHRGTVMAARTHAQQAVPTTFGAKLAVFLTEFARHRERLREAHPRLAVLSLFGAGGTSAALGPAVAEVRTHMARELGLRPTQVPWHVARDGVAEFGHLCALLAATCCRLGREVIDLSRTEIDELHESTGHHRGASSTMPQKANPILSEAIVGMAASAGALASSNYRLMEAGHERAAGEWQIEWHTIPTLAGLAGGCLAVANELVDGWQVRPVAMRENLAVDGGLVMAEAQMMRLAPVLGRERAHDVVYAAAAAARRTGQRLTDLLDGADGADGAVNPVQAEAYLGDIDGVCAAALRIWQADGQPLAREDARP